MGNAAGKVPDGFQFVGLPNLMFNTLGFRNILDKGLDTATAGLLIENRGQMTPQVHDLGVGFSEASFQVSRFSTFEASSHIFGNPGVDQLGKGGNLLGPEVLTPSKPRMASSFVLTVSI